MNYEELNVGDIINVKLLFRSNDEQFVCEIIQKNHISESWPISVLFPKNTFNIGSVGAFTRNGRAFNRINLPAYKLLQHNLFVINTTEVISKQNLKW